MPLIVQKYGGSSLASPKLIQIAAGRIKDLKLSGSDVVVVASAMGNTTDHLLKLAAKTVKTPPSRELDMLLTAGERVSMSLLAMSLQERGIPAISFTGSQSGILTTSDHSEAKILEIRPQRIQEELQKGRVVII
ncbi:MAG: aspartate kinase, partial [Proteobacteria bacterium]|nr:aspartate kinase [Pseudomonadota bacterium]